MIFLAVLVFGYAHALHVLLRSENPRSSEFLGPLESPNNASLGTVNVSQPNNNDFDTYPHAFRSVYFFLGGDFSPISNYAPNTALDLMKIVFYTTTGILMFNIFIALLSNAVTSTSEKGKTLWLYLVR